MVIAILAAITIVAYTGIQQRAKESALASTLQQTVTWLAAQKADTGGVSYPSDLTGLSQNSSYSYDYIVVDNTYCVSVSDGQATSHVVSRATGVKLPGPCPIGHWRLAGNASDSGLYGVNGTVSGSVSPVENQRGESNAAYTFGSGNFIVLSNAVWDGVFNATGPDGFSIGAWVRITAAPSDEAMTILGQHYSSSAFWGIRATGQAILRMDDSDKGAVSNTVVPHGQWQYLTVTYTAGTDRIATYYLNGDLDGSIFVSDGSASEHGNLYIGYQGRTDSGANSPFYGAISDVSLYNKVLSADEVRYLYEATK